MDKHTVKKYMQMSPHKIFRSWVRTGFLEGYTHTHTQKVSRFPQLIQWELYTHIHVLLWWGSFYLDAEGEVCRRSVQFTAVHHRVHVQILQSSHELQVTRFLIHQNTHPAESCRIAGFIVKVLYLKSFCVTPNTSFRVLSSSSDRLSHILLQKSHPPMWQMALKIYKPNEKSTCIWRLASANFGPW